MKLTPENSDDMDCRPVRDVPDIALPPHLEKLLADRKVKLAERDPFKKPLEAAK